MATITIHDLERIRNRLGRIEKEALEIELSQPRHLTPTANGRSAALIRSLLVEVLESLPEEKTPSAEPPRVTPAKPANK